VAEFEYLSLTVEINCRTYDRVYANFWRRSIHELKLFWKGLFGSVLGGDLETGAAYHHIFTFVAFFDQGIMNPIKQEGRDICEEYSGVNEDTLLKELSVQLNHFGSRGWELVEVCRENEIDPPSALYLSGRRRDIFKVHCTLKRLKGKAA